MRYMKAFFDGAITMGLTLAVLVYWEPVKLSLAVFTAALLG